MNDKHPPQSGLQSTPGSKSKRVLWILGGFFGLILLIVLLLAGLGYFTRAVSPSTSGSGITGMQGDTAKAPQIKSKSESALGAARNVSADNYDTARKSLDLRSNGVTVELKSDGGKETYRNQVKGPPGPGAPAARPVVAGPPLTPPPPVPVELGRSNTTVVLPGAGRDAAAP
jgi:hypothetical protein